MFLGGWGSSFWWPFARVGVGYIYLRCSWRTTTTLDFVQRFWILVSATCKTSLAPPMRGAMGSNPARLCGCSWSPLSSFCSCASVGVLQGIPSGESRVRIRQPPWIDLSFLLFFAFFFNTQQGPMPHTGWPAPPRPAVHLWCTNPAQLGACSAWVLVLTVTLARQVALKIIAHT